MTKEATLHLCEEVLHNPDFCPDIRANRLTEQKIMENYDGVEFPDAAAVLIAVRRSDKLIDICAYIENYIQRHYNFPRKEE